MSIIPDSHADILDSMAMWHVATVGPGGQPQSSPVWIGWDGTHVRFSNLTTRQKYRNLAARPEVALSATDPGDPYRYLEVRGRVARIDDDPDGLIGLRCAALSLIVLVGAAKRNPALSCVVLYVQFYAQQSLLKQGLNGISHVATVGRAYDKLHRLHAIILR